MDKPLNVLIWQWGRKGAGPKIAIELAKALKSIHKLKIVLSLSDRAEIINYNSDCNVDLLFKTYSSILGYVIRWIEAPFLVLYLCYYLKKYKINLAICTMPGLLDMIMVAALKILKIPCVVIIHDAYPHPGDGYIFQHFLQKQLIKNTNLIVTFSKYVYDQLREKDFFSHSRFVIGWHPPLKYGDQTPLLLNNKKEVHLVNFGRLLPYKGFNLLNKALDYVKTDKPYLFRIVGHGPKSKVLDLLNQRKNVIVENRWIPENEIASIVEWADAVILPYEEASQSGVLAIALAFSKPVLITRVGGLVEQCHNKDFVFLCDPDPEDIARNIEKILNLPFPLNRKCLDTSEEWEKMARNLMHQIDQKFNLKLKITSS